ncbi:protein WVD2-like 7 isoform X2 [Magnolia sinica]|uniref:protein WVD2-like 7 isoform X2 n=1 Tax=Magnolia sinica TaxID=86752 RepID=UPI002658E5F9|nr:protein WVD2-like 7 isoform X2 [Magnolia sinica]
MEMATDMGRAYCEWSHDEMPDWSDSREPSISQILDHGSISFGRFSVESLSWEKWSVFSHNRCQEELEKFKTPGLVAQKKAYFEAYYKRIRVLKALQDQQTEATLDAGGSSSVYSQTSEEEHNTSQVENTISEIAVTEQTNLCEGNVIEVSIEQEMHGDGPLLQNLAMEPTVSCPDSSIRSINDDSIEEIEQQKNDCMNLDVEGIPNKEECLIAAIEPVTAAPEQMVLPKKRNLNNTQTDSLAPNRVELNKKSSKDVTSIPKAKEPVAALAKDNVKLDSRTKTDVVKSSRGLRYPPHKATGKAESSISSNKANSNMPSISNRSTSTSNSGKAFPNTVSSNNKSTNDSISSKVTSNRVSGSNRNTSISSHRPLTEVRSNITIPRPFSLSTERRSTAPASARDIIQGYSGSKSSNRLAGLSVHKKGMSAMQNTSMDMTATGGMKSTGLTNRRSHEAVRKSAVDSHCTITKGKDMDDQRQKSMSTNLPARSKSNQTSGNESNVRSNNRSEVKMESNLKQFRQSSKLLASLSRTGIPKPDHRKIIPSRSANLTLDSQKSRRGTPCWR